MTSLYSLTAEVLTTKTLLNNNAYRTAITTNEYDYDEEDKRLP